MVHDDGPSGLDAIDVVFDDERVVSDAGLLLCATVADRLGLEALADRHVRLDGRPGAGHEGRKVLSLMMAILAGAGVLARVGVIVRASHEDYDGGGYPNGIAGRAIPIEARICTVCDAFSAMTTDRSYRAAMPVRCALAELRRCAGKQFDSDVVAGPHRGDRARGAAMRRGSTSHRSSNGQCGELLTLAPIVWNAGMFDRATPAEALDRLRPSGVG
jgi:hypothetical protein